MNLATLTNHDSCCSGCPACSLEMAHLLDRHDALRTAARNLEAPPPPDLNARIRAGRVDMRTAADKLRVNMQPPAPPENPTLAMLRAAAREFDAIAVPSPTLDDFNSRIRAARRQS